MSPNPAATPVPAHIRRQRRVLLAVLFAALPVVGGLAVLVAVVWK